MTDKEYLEDHGISEETAKLFGLTSDDNFLHIPIKDAEGEDLFVKSRNLNYIKDGEEPKYKNSTGSTATLFNLHAVKESKNIVLAEGEADTIKLMQEGFSAVSSTGGAGTFPPHFIEALKDKKIWIAYDNDEAGKKGIKKVLELLPDAKIITLPEGSKDVCEYFKVHSKTDFLQLMRLALTKTEWEASNIPEEYTTIDDVELGKTTFESMPWLIESVLYNEGFCFIYGAEGIGKSFITLSMARAVATGQPWLDTFKIPHTTNVLFLDLENPLSMTAKRMNNLGGDTGGKMHWLRYPNGFSLHDGKGGASEFALAVATMVQQKNIGLVVVDSFVDLMVGSGNSAEDTQVFFTGLRQLFPNVSFVVLHHENKPSQGTFRNSSQRLRGSTNINAQAFTMFRLEAVAKSKTDMTLEQTKSRDEQKLDKFIISMRVEANQDGSGTIVKGFDYIGIVTTPDDQKSEEAQELIMSALADSLNGAMSRQNLITIAVDGDVSRATLDRTLKKMEACGKIKKFKPGNAGNNVWFVLKSPIVENDSGQVGMVI